MDTFSEHKNIHTPKRSELPLCPVETCVQLIGSKWRLLIMRDLLMNDSMRFGALQRSVGKISQKVLTSNLRDMEEAGLVIRRVYPEVPPRVEYSLTETGRSLKPIIDAMWAWGEDYQAKAK
ncbi:MAG: helix-turn-helix domain-containing protein [Coriobacteriia bacterium]|nr:helix-turn-helix domain-containing protein [Coriobacteriia bacterium]